MNLSHTFETTFETERLRLRPHRREDFAASFAMWSDPTTTRFIGGAPSTEPQAWQRLLTYAGHWQLMGFGYWLAEDKRSGEFIGEIGFADFKRDIVPSIQGEHELGWSITPRARGKGYATEAVLGAVRWADQNLQVPRTVCMIAPENAASLRVAEKAGYQKWQRTTFKGDPIILFERPVSAAPHSYR